MICGKRVILTGKINFQTRIGDTTIEKGYNKSIDNQYLKKSAIHLKSLI